MNIDSDVPDSGSAFTFGRSRFADNSPGKFWIRDDLILQVACGDEHTALLTASGRVFTFGSNEWGQLGHGHTNALSKPSCVKGLKPHRATIVACGRSHTLVATDSGHVYGFGTNSEGQLGSSHEYTIHTAPVRIQGLENVAIKMLSGGADHSIGLTEKGAVYVWGSGVEGQIGLEKLQCLTPTELKFDSDVMCISAGYYHSAFVTVDGHLYTCGENESGKLGVSDAEMKRISTPHLVTGIDGRVVYVSCGGNHTVALTASGKAYSFGNGFNGQLGIGDRILETYIARIVNFPTSVKIARVSCGENHTAFLTDNGYLYTCGDRRHGKVGFAEGEDEGMTNLFSPTLVKCLRNLQVQQVSCGGCHMLVLAMKRKGSPSNSETYDSCPARKREMIRNSQLPPLDHYSNIECQKNTGSVQSLKNSNRPRLPSITKSPVWYVPLEKVVDPSKDSEQDPEDEILSKLEYRCSLLNSLEENEIIRHVDSDVESDGSDVCELNKRVSIDIEPAIAFDFPISLHPVKKTYSFIRIDDTVSVVRPVIAKQLERVLNKSNWFPENKSSKLSLPNNNSTANVRNGDNPSFHPGQQCNASPAIKGEMAEDKSNRKIREVRKSLFYDGDDESGNGDRKSSSSTISKSSKACVLL